jgi:phosphoribosylformylglycinamidine cyclo-ligase
MTISNRSSVPKSPLTYDAAGVSAGRELAGLKELGKWIIQTFRYNPIEPVLPLGYFANVLPLSADLGLAISTDGVGTKLLVAQALGKFDTVGIDCVAMNVNDVLCVGAKPISMVDYIAISEIEPAILGEIARGLHDGARLAGINIPGGEIAQIRELLREDSNNGYSFDLVGTCIGTVQLQRLIVGQNIEPGDLVVGIESSGIHSNGLTLARKALGLIGNAGSGLSEYCPELGHTLGEELLRPTNIYVSEILAMLESDLAIKALIHITGDGLLNLARVNSETGYVIDRPVKPSPIFSMIRDRGNIEEAEMFRVFNLGTGFCVITTPDDAPKVERIAAEHGHPASVIGYTVNDPERRIWIPSHGLVGSNHTFRNTTEKPPAYPQQTHKEF